MLKACFKLLPLLMLLSACQEKPPLAQLISELPAQLREIYQLRLASRGAQEGASLAVRLKTADSFGIKNSSPGAAAYSYSNILAYRVFLVSSASPPSGVLSPYQSTIVTVPDNNSPSQTLVFSNLPAGSFYACAAAFKHGSLFTPFYNITEDLGAPASYSEGPVACSSSGGSDSAGRVEVDSELHLSGSGVVGLELTLRGARGASIETNVTIQDGVL